MSSPLCGKGSAPPQRAASGLAAWRPSSLTSRPLKALRRLSYCQVSSRDLSASSKSIHDIQHGDRVPHSVTAELRHGPSAADGQRTQAPPLITRAYDGALRREIWHEARCANLLSDSNVNPGKFCRTKYAEQRWMKDIKATTLDPTSSITDFKPYLYSKSSLDTILHITPL